MTVEFDYWRKKIWLSFSLPEKRNNFLIMKIESQIFPQKIPLQWGSDFVKFLKINIFENIESFQQNHEKRSKNTVIKKYIAPPGKVHGEV